MSDIYRLLIGENAMEWRVRPPDFDAAALVETAIRILPPADEYDITCLWGVALSKLKTLSRLPHDKVPDSPELRAALWACAGACAFPDDRRRTAARLDHASKKILALTHGVPPREREAFRRRLGTAADAMARLIHYGIRIIEKGE